jgi:ABC-2 type transport system permease protein
VSIRLTSHGIYGATVSNVTWLPNIVQAGQLDGYMLRPLPVYRQVLLARFPVNCIGDTSVGCLMLWFTLGKLHLAWTPINAGYLAAGVIGGALVEGAIQTAVSASAFKYTDGLSWTWWADYTVSTLGNYPLNILPGVARSILTYVFPLAFAFYLPAAAITGRASTSGVPTWLAWASPLVGLGWFVLARVLWNRAMRNYLSVGG